MINAGRQEVKFSKKGNQTTTRSKTKQPKQQREIESLASLSSPVATRNPKKLSTVSEDQNQAAVDSPER